MKIFTYLKTIASTLIICCSGSALGQGIEDFNGITSTSGSYVSISWDGNNGLKWQASDSRADQKVNTTKAICIRQTSGKLIGPLTPDQQTTGVGVISFTAKNTASTADNTKATTYQFKCGSVTKTITIPPMGANSAIVTSPEINSTDATQIEITITALSGVRITIDDLSWTAATPATAPFIKAPASLNAFSTSTIESVSQTITVGGTNLTNDISFNITGTDAQYFSATPSSLTQIGGSVADTDVTVTYTPKVAGTHTATLTLASDGANSVTYNLSGTATLPTLATPIAKDATLITEKSFTANWDNIIGATDYELSVDKREGIAEVIYLNENFDSCTGTGGNDDKWSGSIATTGFPKALTDASWSHISGTSALSCTKLGSGSSQGSITTPALTGLTGTATLTFRAGAWDGSSEQTELLLSISEGSLSVPSVTIEKAKFNTYTVTITGATPTSKITFKGKQNSNSRFFLDDVKVFGGGTIETPIAGSPFTVTGANSYEVTGLQQNTNYVYSVIAKATGYNDSERSNEIAVKTIIVPDEEVGSINQITDPNKFYKINEELEGVTKLGDLLIVKSGKGTHPNKTTQPATLQGDDDKDEFFEQASWISFSLPPTSENYVGKTIESGAVGKLNPTSGALEIAQITAPISKTDAYDAFYTDKDNKYNCFRIKNFFPAIYDNYFIQPRHNEIAYITYVMYKEENGKKYFHDGTNQIEVKETYATIPAEAKNLGAGDGYSFKALFVKQPTVGRAISSEWALEFLEGGEVVTGVNDATINGDEATVIGANGAIEVFATDNNSINVYDLSGSIVRTINNADSHTSINIPAGAYIVKVDNKVVKVIVR